MVFEFRYLKPLRIIVVLHQLGPDTDGHSKKRK